MLQVDHFTHFLLETALIINEGDYLIFMILCHMVGGEFSWHVVLVMGFSTIAANALSMGAGEYLSSKAHREFIQAEKRRELWEFKHFKDIEIKEVNEIYDCKLFCCEKICCRLNHVLYFMSVDGEAICFERNGES